MQGLGIPDNIGPSLSSATEIKGVKLLWSKIRTFYYRHIYRHIPHLVWPHQEVEVGITFTHLPLGTSGVHFESLWQAENALHEVGLSFDTGAGCNGRDWEWDWSLKGPVQVRFYRVRKKSVPLDSPNKRMLHEAQVQVGPAVLAALPAASPSPSAGRLSPQGQVAPDHLRCILLQRPRSKTPVGFLSWCTPPIPIWRRHPHRRRQDPTRAPPAATPAVLPKTEPSRKRVIITLARIGIKSGSPCGFVGVGRAGIHLAQPARTGRDGIRLHRLRPRRRRHLAEDGFLIAAAAEVIELVQLVARRARVHAAGRLRRHPCV